MTRKIALDTETTGLKPTEGHRLVEIGCVELQDDVPTGKTWHTFLDPEREIPEEAIKIHGVSTEDVKGQPRFADVVDALFGFLEDSKLVIHNAAFDMGFLNHELRLAKKQPLPMSRAIDTLTLARRQRPNTPASLDALCRAFGIDLSTRSDRHGALIDAHLLAQVYLELKGGRQQRLSLAKDAQTAGGAGSDGQTKAREMRPAREHSPSPEEAVAHEAMLTRLENPVWRRKKKGDSTPR